MRKNESRKRRVAAADKHFPLTICCVAAQEDGYARAAA
jgi:hypothetical protein